MSFAEKVVKAVLGTGKQPSVKSRKSKENRIILLLIDAENSKADPKKIMIAVKKKYGFPRVATAYSKWTANPQRSNSPIRKYREAGIECTTCDTGDNNADLMLSVDAMELMFNFHEDPNRKYLIIGADGDRGYSHVFGKAKKFGWKTVLCTDSLEIEKNEILHSAADEILQLSNLKKISKSPIKEINNVNTKKSNENGSVAHEELDIDISKVISDATTFPPITGFSTMNKPSLRFPAQPRELVTILVSFENLRSTNSCWTESKTITISKKFALSRVRIGSVVKKLNWMLPVTITNENIDWSKIPSIGHLIEQFKDSILQKIKGDKNIDMGLIPEIEKYFDQAQILVQNSTIEEISENLSIEKSVSVIEGFNTPVSKNQRSLEYPKEPKDAVRILLLLFVNKNKEITWNQMRKKMESIKGIGKARILRIYRVIGKIFNKKNDNDIIDWTDIPRLKSFIELMQQDAIGTISEKKLVTKKDLPRVSLYFKTMKKELKTN
jgi:hypothetical protein